MKEIRLSIYYAAHVELSKVLAQYKEVFEDGLGTLKNYEAHLEVDPKAQPHLSPYFDKKQELSSFEGCLLWGSRVIIPETCRKAILAQLHEGHQGMVRTKSLARMYVW